MSEERVPTVDLRDYTSDLPGRREAFVRALGEGLERFGFVGVTGHGVDPALLDRAYALARRTFALPASVKARYESPEDGRQRGYTSFGVEHAKDTPVADLKEFWHVGRRGDGAPHKLPPNLFPAEIDGFEPTFQALFDALEDFAHRLLDAVGEHLGKPPAFFREMVHGGNSVLRVIHYPDVGEAHAGAVRAAAHEDINLLTVLPPSTRPGLELQTRDGRWLSVQTPPGAMICDTGDMMALLTAGRLPATTHRVVNPETPDGGRLSMPFFLHPRPDYLLTPMAEGYAEPIAAHAFLMERLRANGVA